MGPLWCYVRGFVQWSGPPHGPPHRVEGGDLPPPCGATSGVSCSGLGPPTGPPTGWRGGPPSPPVVLCPGFRAVVWAPPPAPPQGGGGGLPPPLWCYVQGFVQWSGPPHRHPHRVEGGTSLPPVVLCPGFRAVVWAPLPAPPQGGGGDLPPPLWCYVRGFVQWSGPPHRPPHRVEWGPPSPPVVLCPGFRAVVWA